MNNSGYNEEHALHNLKHFLPAQAPLKDFIHHNTLHAFQHDKFHYGVHKASEMFGYKTYLRLDEYRKLFKEKKIHPEILNKVIRERKGADNIEFWHVHLLDKEFDTNLHPRIGKLRNEWKNKYKINISKETHPVLLRIIGNYVDQGIAIRNFPLSENGLLASIKDLERNSFISLFTSKRVRMLFNSKTCTIKTLLDIIVGDESLFEQYLFDQQFEHPGWSGMVSVLEDNPTALLDKRNISLREFIFLELLLEIDVLDVKFLENWSPLRLRIEQKPESLFSKINESELFEVLAIWQEAYEWSYYDLVLTSIQQEHVTVSREATKKTFQAIFCIDDRECSFRRYLEQIDIDCKTYATAGFFNVEFYFQPEGGKFHTKVCPAPVTPKFLIREENKNLKHDRDVHFTKQTHSLVGGWLSQTIGFWSAVKLFFNIFRPSLSPATSYSFQHMNKLSSLTIENKNKEDKVDGLQVGFTVEEMADRVEGLLKSIGLVKDFAPLVYIVGHGASSVNNTYYAGYDCGACSGRPGSANARVAANMANHKKVREILKTRGLEIPEATQFIGALQDTTRDEIDFFDETILSVENKNIHELNKVTFYKALDNNAKERARRFVTMSNQKSAEEIHKKVKLRSVSLFEPRPEYNHATNALCIVGRRELSSHLFLDRRSFLNSFDYRVDPEGKYLLNILKAVAPVCGGINLEYYFSRVDNQKLGAGSKLPHNVIGLIGVANGADGDLRTGLPLQMIEIHDPLRLLVMVEHFPDVIIKTLKQNEATYEWFINDWIHLIAIHPETKELYKFKDGIFAPYISVTGQLNTENSIGNIIERESENIAPFELK
jgi:hypothetical protein